MKKKLPYLLPSIVFFLGAPVVWLLCFREVPLRISPETTYITEPKTVDGKSIDYFRAIKDRFEPKCKPEENGFRMIVAALGKSPYFDEPEWYWPELCKELDLDPDLTPTLKFESPHEFLKREYLLWLDKNETAPQAETIAEPRPGELTDTEKLKIRLQSEPWTAEEFPFMARWIEENSPLLDLLAEAVRKEHFFLPLQRPTGEAVRPIMLLNINRQCGLGFFYDIKMGLALRAQFRRAAGDVAGADRDLMSIAWYAAHSARLPFEDPRISAESLSLPEEEVSNLPKPLTFEEFSLQCRLILLYDAEYNSRNVWRARHVDWNIVFRTINRYFDRFNSDPVPPPPRSPLGRFFGKPITVAERSKELGWAFFHIYRSELVEYAAAEK